MLRTPIRINSLARSALPALQKIMLPSIRSIGPCSQPCTMLSSPSGRSCRVMEIVTLAGPSGVSNSPFGDGLRIGALVEFINVAGHSLGVIEGFSGGKWTVHDKEGLQHKVRSQDITLLLPGKEYTRKSVRDVCARAEAADPTVIEDAWMASQSIPQPIALSEITKIALGSKSPANLYSAYFMLKQKGEFFRQVGKDPPLYYRRSESESKAALALKEAREAAIIVKEKELKEFEEVTSALLRDKQKKGLEAWSGNPHEHRILALKEFAVGSGPQLDIRNLAVESLRALNMGLTPNSAATLMEELGILPPYAPLPLLRAGITATFTDELEAQAQAMAANPPVDVDSKIRRDLTHLKVVTIDPEGTKDVDDGLSVEYLDDSRTRVWIHIADPARYVPFGHDLDLEALSRTTTMFLPTGMVPCFPSVLGQDMFSLEAGKKCCALSISVILSSDGKILNYEVVNSTIVPTQAIPYSDVLKAIADGGEDLKTLIALAKKREALRESQGALSPDLPECKIRVDTSDVHHPKVTIVREARDDSARKMVAEMMILAGDIIGRIGRRGNLPLPYRSQPPPVLPKNLRDIPSGMCRSAAIRRRMVGGVLSTTPSKHSSLGLAAYVQVTSPIRRSADLLAHRQIKAHLRGDKPPMNQKMLDNYLVRLAHLSRIRQKVETDSGNYWKAEYFRQNMAKRTWEGILLVWLKQPQGLAIALIDELGLEVRIRVSRPITLGTILTLGVAEVDVKSGMVRLEERSTSA